MNSFMQRHEPRVNGCLRGFDRLLFHGTVRTLAYAAGMMRYLFRQGVMLLDFGEYAKRVSEEIKEASLGVAAAAGIEPVFLQSAGVNKDQLARKIAARSGVEQGLAAVITCVEPCSGYDVAGDRRQKKIRLVHRYRKCLHVYHYHQHPQLGWMYARLQTWLPFTISIGINGREWLARQLDRAGIGYLQRDNCFVELSDVPAAQRLADQQLRTNWPRLLDSLALGVCPAHSRVLGADMRWYWTAMQTEWASDVMFRSAQDLAEVYPALTRHALFGMECRDVLRFLGRRATQRRGGSLPAHLATDLKTRAEGVRVKHQSGANSIKMYDKQQVLLRVETTINDPAAFKTFRRPEGEPQQERKWMPLRKGVADLQRRAKISDAANQRYLEALAGSSVPRTLQDLLQPVCRPIKHRGKRVRALQPLVKDAPLLLGLGAGEFNLSPIRNRDVQRLLFGSSEPADDRERRRRSAAASRAIAMLRKHKVLAKVPKCNRYNLTRRGREIVAALALSLAADPAKLAAA
jgi:hypothetical protein